jgi:hypothetical protein
VKTGLFLGAEDTSGLADVVGTGLAPGDGSRVLGVELLDGDTINDEVAIDSLDFTLVLAVDGVVLEEVDLWRRGGAKDNGSGQTIVVVARKFFISTHHVLDVHERIVDGDDGNLGVSEGSAAHEAADTAEAIDSDLDRHVRVANLKLSC